MNVNAEKYSSFVIEISLKSRPFLLVSRIEDYPQIISHNDEFDKLYRWDITKYKLNHSNDFIQVCDELLNSRPDMTDTNIIYLGADRHQVDLYCKTYRTSQAGNLPVNRSDLLMIQVDCVEYQSYLKSSSLSVPDYQTYVDDALSKLKNEEISGLFDDINLINEFVTNQRVINNKLIELEKFISSHPLMVVTKKVTIKSLFKYLCAFLTFISPFLLSNSANIQLIKDINTEIIRLFADESD